MTNAGHAGMQSGRMSGLLCGLAAALIWGGFPVITRFGATRAGLDMYDITFIRFSVASLLTFPVLLRSKRPSWRLTATLTLGIGAPYILVVSDGLTHAPVALFAVLTPGIMVMFSTGLGAFLLKERLSLRQGAGIVAIVVGSALVTLEYLLLSPSIAIPAGLFVLGGFLWAVYTVSAKQSHINAITATATVSVASILGYAPVYFYLKGFELLRSPWSSILEQAIYQGVLVSVVALYFYSKAVSLLGATIGASFAALVPVLATIEAALLLGELPSSASIIGLAISVVGIAAVLAAPKSRVTDSRRAAAHTTRPRSRRRARRRAVSSSSASQSLPRP